jgi:arginine/serine-rich splicing factor 7
MLQTDLIGKPLFQDEETGAGKRSGSRSRTRSRSPKRKRRSRSRSRSKQRSSRRRSSRSRSRDDDGFNEAEGFRLHVADLDPNAEKRDLERIFGKYGPLKEIWMAKSSPCFAFVVFRYREDAEDAQRKADGTEVCGRRIRVTVARPRSRGSVATRDVGRRGFDPSMKCYQCGERGHFSRDCPDSKYGYRRPSSPSRRY